MTDNTARLRRQIGSATDLQSVVRAMKAQAAASVGQYATSVAALGDYARTVEWGLGACFRQAPPAATVGPRGPATPSRPIRAVVFGSDQGLVGRFNEAIVEYAVRTLLTQHPDAQVWAVGERTATCLAGGGIQAQGSFAVPATVQSITRLVTELLVTVVGTTPASAEPGNATALHLFHHRPAPGSAYQPVHQRLLPLDGTWCRTLARQAWPTPLPPELMGGPGATLRGLIREHVFVSIFRASAESLASENASRLAAMDRADRNIEKMLQQLHDRFHRLRQRKIDEELSDVISGFKALNRPIAP